MRRYILVCLAILLAACGDPGIPDVTPVNESQIVSDTVIAFLREQGRAEPYTVEVGVIEGNWALAQAQPVDTAAEPLWALLELANEEWTVIALKPSFTAGELEALGIPEAAWPPELALQESTATPTRQPLNTPEAPPADPPAATSVPTTEPATPTAAGPPGTISGRLSYPSDVVPALDIYVVNIDDPQQFYQISTEMNQTEYTISGIQPGTYYVTAFLPAPATFGAGYTMAVPCGLTHECTDHRLLEVELEPGAILEDISPMDWYADEGDIPAPPSGQPLPTQTP